MNYTELDLLPRRCLSAITPTCADQQTIHVRKTVLLEMLLHGRPIGPEELALHLGWVVSEAIDAIRSLGDLEGGTRSFFLDLITCLDRAHRDIGMRCAMEQRSEKKRHALVVGGTGMLRRVCLWMAATGYTVSVVARGRSRLEELAREAEELTGTIHPVVVDYNDVDRLRGQLQAASEELGAIELAVCWIHSTSPAALQAIMEIMGRQDSGPRLIHVIGSATSNPLRLKWLRSRSPSADDRVTYETILLGFVREEGRSRWLTDSEIASGVIETIRRPSDRTVIGTISPWSMRP